MRRSNHWRVNGPTKHGRKWRVTFSRGSGREREVAYESFDTQAEADACIANARDEAQGLTVKGAVDKLLEHKRAKGVAESTVEYYEHRLWMTLGLPANASRPVRWVTRRGAELYQASMAGHANDTHISGLVVAKMWGAWCVKQRILKVDPFAEVEPMGRRRRGSTKPRLTVNESRQLEAYCLAKPDDPDRVLTYGYLMLGKRASELAGLTVRDLDDDGWLVRITKSKTEASETAVGVPETLRPMLLGLANGKAPDAHLFVNQSGAPMSRYVARERVMAVLKAAGVPALPPQALRRTFTDNAGRQGFALRAIADMTGHETPAVTQRSYISAGVVDGAAVERNFKVLAGGKR